MPNDMNENQAKLVALCKATGALPFTTLWGQDTRDAIALVRAGVLKRARHAYVLAPQKFATPEPVCDPSVPNARDCLARNPHLANPCLLTQDNYDAIRAYVSHGYALHPDHAADLLHTLEALWRAADTILGEGEQRELSEVMFTPEGLPRLALVKRAVP